jgi:threonine/homoserine/homoserine lactone efflux protein
MFEYLIIGGGFAFAAAIQPGPLQAFLLSSVASKGWVRTLPACLAPLLSDGPIVLLVLLVINRVPVTVSRLLQAAGGVLLLYLAWSSYKEWRRQERPTETADGSTPSTILQAAAVNLLNPNPYLAWSLVLGPALLRAWAEGPGHAVAFMVAFYGTLVTVLAGTIVLMGATRLLGPRGRRALVLVAAMALAALGVYQLVSSLLGIGI